MEQKGDFEGYLGAEFRKRQGEGHPVRMTSENDAKTPFFASDSGAQPELSGRSKSAQRLRYEAEVSALKRRVGGLEDVRQRLGLTQRKMAQLLLVDPSAWTRWTRNGEDAPPVVYRALQWFLLLEEKYPAADARFWLATVAREAPRADQAVQAKLNLLEARLAEMQAAATRPTASPETPRTARVLFQGILFRYGAILVAVAAAYGLGRWR